MIGNNISSTLDIMQNISTKSEIGIRAASKMLLYSKIVIPLGIITGIALSILFPPYTGLVVVPLIAYASYRWIQGININNDCEAPKLNAKALKEYLDASIEFERLDLKIRTIDNREKLEEQMAIMWSSINFIQEYLKINQLPEPEELRQLNLATLICYRFFLTMFYETDSAGNAINPDKIPELSINPERKVKVKAAEDIIKNEIPKIKGFCSLLIEINEDNLCEYLHTNKIDIMSPALQTEMKARKEARIKKAQDIAVLNMQTSGGEDDSELTPEQLQKLIERLESV